MTQMAERPHKSKARKSQPIEPLDWSAMAHSPALKGMVSFLEVTPEDIRRQRTGPNDPRIGASETLTGSDPHTGSESPIPFQRFEFNPGRTEQERSDETVRDSHTGVDSHTGSGTPIGGDTHIGSDALIGSESHTIIDPRTTKILPELVEGPVSDSHIGSGGLSVPPARVASSPQSVHSRNGHGTTELLKDAVNGSRPGSDAPTGSDSHIGSEARTGAYSRTFAGLNDSTGSDAGTGSDPLTGARSTPVSHSREDESSQVEPDTLIQADEKPNGRSPVSDTHTGKQPRATYFVTSDPYAKAPRRMPMLQGEVVWQNRKIRRCVLAQDAHSQGEDALFSAMWSAAKPDPGDPTGSRTLRIGYAELSQKSRMHRSNVRINIGGLRAKLAIEVLDEHDSRDVTPRTYRLYSFKEILERRRVAGLEYVIRKKSVVFVTETGEPLPLPGLPKAGIRRPRNADSNGSAEVRRMTEQDTSPEQMDFNVRQISDAMSQHWPVDQAAAQQLLRQCRGVRRDAEIDEIVFFVNEKLQIALTNPNIKNPTGLILATVPQCFEGSTFEEFRRRRNDGLRLRAEEEERKRQQERDLQQWLDRRLQELRTIAEDVSQSEASREKARRELKQYGG